jgi:Kdo2-lipid IVA lauroyltransferase/acyltransferase
VRTLLETISYIGVFLVFKAGGVLVKVLPRPFVLVVARRFADVGFILIYRFRQRSIRNLRLAYGDLLGADAIVAMARRSIRNFFYAFAEVGFALSKSLDEIRSEIPIQGKAHLERALAKHKGVIVLSAHLGNFFLLGTRLAAEGYCARVLVKPSYRDSTRFDELMDSYRLKSGQRTIRARPRRRAARELIRTLRQNELAILIADEFRSKGLTVRFFGRYVRARRGPATLAMRTGAAVVPMSLVREGNGSLRLIIEPEIELIRTGRPAQDVVANTLRLTQWLETTVRAYPDQWNWTTVRWQKPEPDSKRADEEGKRRFA